MEAAGRIADREHAGRAWLAWHITTLPRMKTLPRLSDLTGIKPRLVVQSTEEIKGMFARMRGEAG